MREMQPVSGDESLEALVLRVFLKTIDLVGGPRTLAERRHLTWANSLMSASYIIVLHEEALKSVNEIAAFLGLSRATVQNVLHANPDLALAKVQDIAEEEKDIHVHIAGGLAKQAYRLVRQGLEEPRVLRFFMESFAELLGIDWASRVLKAIRGLEFPLNDPAVLAEHLKGVKLNGHDAEDITPHLKYPIDTPSDLLRQLRQWLENQRQDGQAGATGAT